MIQADCEDFFQTLCIPSYYPTTYYTIPINLHQHTTIKRKGLIQLDDKLEKNW